MATLQGKLKHFFLPQSQPKADWPRAMSSVYNSAKRTATAWAHWQQHPTPAKVFLPKKTFVRRQPLELRFYRGKNRMAWKTKGPSRENTKTQSQKGHPNDSQKRGGSGICRCIWPECSNTHPASTLLKTFLGTASGGICFPISEAKRIPRHRSDRQG